MEIMPEFKVGDHVEIREWDEGVGVVRRVLADGYLWVETLCNTWRNYPPDMFVKSSEPLPEALDH